MYENSLNSSQSVFGFSSGFFSSAGATGAGAGVVGVCAHTDSVLTPSAATKTAINHPLVLRIMLSPPRECDDAAMSSTEPAAQRVGNWLQHQLNAATRLHDSPAN